MYVYLVAVEEGEYWQQWIRSSCTTCESFPRHDIVKHANCLSVTTTTTATMREGLRCNSDSTNTPTTPNPKSTRTREEERRGKEEDEEDPNEDGLPLVSSIHKFIIHYSCISLYFIYVCFWT
jgi:hypothetical protein